MRRCRPAIALALLGSCSFLRPQADRTQYFLLKPLAVPERQPVGGFARTVGLGPFDIPDHLETTLVTRLAANQIAISDTDRWGEPLRDGLPRVLRQNLIALLRTERVLVYPWDLSASPDLAVRVEVLQFERTIQGMANLAVRWTLERGADRTPLLTEETRVSEPIRATGTRAAVAALSSAVVVLSRSIAAAVRAAPLHVPASHP
jgi:uncharacterized lipoprotein YmbA